MKFNGLDQKLRASQIVQLLRVGTRGMVEPATSSIVAKWGKNPFLILVSCILSLRTKDTVSLPASERLFTKAQTPEQLLNLSLAEIERLIYPCGFFRQKSKQLKQLSLALIEKFNGKVPSTEQELLELTGVGRKTANLVLSEAFDIPALCVDTHVHRISNRLGLVDTRTPEETEIELKKVIPQEYWRDYTRLLVTWGQNICVPISPHCSICPLFDLCERKGVTTSR